MLGPEMRSTGEVMGFDADFGTAFAKSQTAAFGSLPTSGRVFVSMANRDKRSMIFPIKVLADLGFEILATQGTAEVLRRNGVARHRRAQALRGPGPERRADHRAADRRRRDRPGHQHPARLVGRGRLGRASTATRSAPPRSWPTSRASPPSRGSAPRCRASRRWIARRHRRPVAAGLGSGWADAHDVPVTAYAVALRPRADPHRPRAGPPRRRSGRSGPPRPRDRRRLARSRRRAPVRAMGLTFPHPLGLAAGFDKNAVGIDALAALGFGHVEVGTVTGEPQPGNPQPAAVPAARRPRGGQPDGLQQRRRRGGRPAGWPPGSERAATAAASCVGVNIGKTKVVPEDDQARCIADYAKSARLLAPHADYLVVNVSSPNTPGLRNLQAVDRLGPLLEAVRRRADDAADRRVPLLVKIAPDLADDDVAGGRRPRPARSGSTGSSPPTPRSRRDGLRTARGRGRAIGAGGLSGRAAGRAVARGAAAAAKAGRRRAHADLASAASATRRGRAGAPRRRRDAGAGLHRLHLRRPALAAPDRATGSPGDRMTPRPRARPRHRRGARRAARSAPTAS